VKLLVRLVMLAALAAAVRRLLQRDTRWHDVPPPPPP
jgi:hypothetical protein